MSGNPERVAVEGAAILAELLNGMRLDQKNALSSQLVDRIIKHMALNGYQVTFGRWCFQAKPAINEASEHNTLTATALNRRAEVEQILFDAATGKLPLPGANECRALAMKLGVPDELRDQRFDSTLRQYTTRVK